MLTKSTPEGARDYLVPSRVHPGEFYALPQSPQIFKQILMISGMDRYFQIVKCFRDEDLRADRQPEFTQVDLEISFATEDLVFSTIEPLMERLMALIGREAPRPFLRLPYAEAIAKYGSDKPDLRPGMEIQDLSAAFAESTFSVFRDAVAAGGEVRGFVVKGGAKYSRKELDELSSRRSSSARPAWSGRATPTGAIQSSALKAAGEETDPPGARSGGRRRRRSAADGRRERTSRPRRCSARCACTSRRRRTCSIRTASSSSGSSTFRCSSGIEEEAAATSSCTIPFTAPLESDARAARNRPGPGARARLRPGAERQRDRRRQHPDPRPGAAAADLQAAADLGRGGADCASGSSSMRSNTARRRTAASPSASTASSRSCAANRRSATSSRFRRPPRRSGPDGGRAVARSTTKQLRS